MIAARGHRHLTSLSNKEFLPKELPVRDNPLLLFLKVGINSSHTKLVVDQILVSPTSTWNSPVSPTQLLIVLQLLSWMTLIFSSATPDSSYNTTAACCSFALSRSTEHNPTLSDLLRTPTSVQIGWL